MASLVAVVSDDPEWTAAAGPLWPVIEGLLHKDPERRLTADQVRLMLDGLLSAPTEAPAHAETDDAPPIPALPVPREQAGPHGEPDSVGTDPAGTDSAGTSTSRTETDGTGAGGSYPDDPVTVGDAVMTHHLGERTERSLVRPGRGPLLWAAAALAAVLAAGGLTVALALSHGGSGHTSAKVSARGSARTSPGTSASSPAGSAKASPTASATESAALRTSGTPAGFTVRKDSSGYSILVPKGWSGPERKNGGDFYYSPDRSTFVQVDQTSHPHGSAIKDWRDQEPSVARQLAGYHLVRIGPATQGGPVTDPSGVKAADWEYTWQSGTGRRHVLSRNLIMNGHGYAIVISAPDGQWDRARSKLAPVYEHFLPGPRP
jgi:hypothetical protein